MKLIKTASGESIKISKSEWSSIGEKTGWLREAQFENNPLNGKSKQSARNFIYRVVGDLTKGFFKDESWEHIRAIWSALDLKGIENNISDAQYFKDEHGQPSGKMWKFEVPFVNNKGKQDMLYGTLTAHFAGSVKDPSERYDISFVI